MKRRCALARAEAAYAALRRAVTADGRRAALCHLARAHREFRAQLAEETSVDRQWLNNELADAVVGQDLDRLQELADYAKTEDPDTARDIHGKLIKPHQEKWAS